MIEECGKRYAPPSAGVCTSSNHTRFCGFSLAKDPTKDAAETLMTSGLPEHQVDGARADINLGFCDEGVCSGWMLWRNGESRRNEKSPLFPWHTLSTGFWLAVGR